MADYKLSQNPTEHPEAEELKRLEVTKPKPHKQRKSGKPGKSFKGPRRDVTGLSPMLVIGGILGAIILVAAGIAWAHWIIHLGQPKTANGSSQATTNASGHTASTSAAPVVSGQTLATVTSAITNKNPNALKSLYAKKVHVVIDRTTNTNVDGSQVAALIGDPLNSAQNPWNFHLPPGTIAQWQTGADGQYFSGNVLIGESNDGQVIVIGFDDNGQIDSVFIAPVADVTAPPSTGNSGGSSTDNSGGTTGSNTDNGSSNTPPPTNPNGDD